MTSPLAGVKVIDLTIWVQGPLAGQLLADLGANVIKVEKPGGGDFSRGLTTLFGASMKTSEGKALLWELANRNKSAIAIDPRRAEGQDLLKRLVQDADIFLTNLQPSTLRRFKALPEDLQAVNPRLIYAWGAGLGTRGELAELPAQDTTGTAYSGFMYTASRDDEPYYPPGALADVLSGTNLAFGVLAALLERDRTGGGQVVSTSILQSMVWLQQLNIGTVLNTPDHLKRFDRQRPSNAFMNLYRCADGEWLALGVTSLSQDDWFAFCNVIGRPDLREDARLARSRGRVEHASELVGILSAVLRTRPVDEWVTLLRDLEFPCAPVRHIDEIWTDPAIRSEELIVTTPSGMNFVRPPFNLGRTQQASRDAPLYGQDTFTILSDLGISAEEIARLQQEEIVG